MERMNIMIELVKKENRRGENEQSTFIKRTNITFRRNLWKNQINSWLLRL